MDPDRVVGWSASIGHAIDEVTRLAPSDGPVVLIGLRGGATLATYAALERTDVDAMVLWAPVTRGRRWVREQKAFSKMAYATAAHAEAEPFDWGRGGFESNGYAFMASTVDDLGGLDLTACASPGCDRVLILERDDVPGAAADLEHWCGAARVETRAATGYLPMMDPPISMSLPKEAVNEVCGFVSDLASPGMTCVLEDLHVCAAAEVAPNILERGVWYDDEGLLFGVLTLPLPRDLPPASALILLNNAKGNRTGPHGMNPGLARRLAEEGVATLRLDLAGIGDSYLPTGRPEHDVYGLDTVADVRAAVAFLRRMGIDHIAVGGLCSGAYLAWHAAKEIEDIDRVIMLNLQLFEWEESRSLLLNPLQTQYESDYYAQAMRSPDKWRKLLGGEVDVVGAMKVLAARLWNEVVARTHDLRVGLRLLPPSRIVEDVRALSERGVRLRFIFSGRDPGLAVLKGELGSEMKALIKGGQIRVDVVEGSDHSFTPRWATERLVDLYVDEFAVSASQQLVASSGPAVGRT
jgi:dienelactone hydrolase